MLLLLLMLVGVVGIDCLAVKRDYACVMLLFSSSVVVVGKFGKFVGPSVWLTTFDHLLA